MSMVCNETEALLWVAYNITPDEWDASKAGTSYYWQFTPFLELSSSPSSLLPRFVKYDGYAKLKDFEACLPRDECSQVVVAGLPSDGYQLSFDGNTIEIDNEFYFDGINPATSTFVGICTAPICSDTEALFELDYWSGYASFDVAFRVEDKDGENLLGEEFYSTFDYQTTKSYACLPKHNACYTFLIGRRDQRDPAYYSPPSLIPSSSMGKLWAAVIASFSTRSNLVIAASHIVIRGMNLFWSSSCMIVGTIASKRSMNTIGISALSLLQLQLQKECYPKALTSLNLLIRSCVFQRVAAYHLLSSHPT